MAKNALLGDPVSGVHPVGPVVYTISGNVSSASPNVNMNGKPAARVGDTRIVWMRWWYWTAYRWFWISIHQW